jgi:ABC-type transporter Mla subunit MlaD
MAFMMTGNRNPGQINTTLDRTEQILADLTVRLDRLEINVEANTTAILALTHRLDTFVDQTNDSIARTNAAVDRLAGVFASYMEQATVERSYQRTVN